MAQDISALGLKVTVVAVPSYPTGITLTQFADDVDPFDIQDITIMNSGMGVNGDMVIYRTAQAIPVSIGLIPGTDECNSMENLFKLNMVQKDKVASKDVITMTVEQPDGTVTVFTGGYVVGGIPSPSYSSAGRAKSRTFRFMFEKIAN